MEIINAELDVLQTLFDGLSTTSIIPYLID